MEGMYSISEMAAIFSVTRQTLIYYDKIGLFRPAVINDKGYRFYSPTQIPLMRLICMLRDLGLELEEIAHLVNSYSLEVMTDKLRDRVGELDVQISKLQDERADVRERLSFYDDAVYWRAREGVPTLKYFPERHIVVEPFPGDMPVGRPMLHPTLMKAIAHMKDLLGARPMRGWGAMLQRNHFHAENPILGAGSFAVVPEGADPTKLDQTYKLPEGIYLCISRWGMPYDPTGIRTAVSYLDEHGLKAVDNAFDFCYLDATSYTEDHQEDFCCIQIPVEL